MVAQNVIHRASSHQITNLWRFADKCNIPWNLPHQLSFRPDCNNTAKVPSFTLRTALSAIPLVSDRCGVDVQLIPGEIFTSFAEFQGIVSVKWLWVSSRAPRTFASFSLFPVKFLFCTDTTGSIEWPSPAPRLHIGDCFEIHNFQWEPCDLTVIESPKFSARGTAPPLRMAPL